MTAARALALKEGWRNVAPGRYRAITERGAVLEATRDKGRWFGRFSPPEGLFEGVASTSGALLSRTQAQDFAETIARSRDGC